MLLTLIVYCHWNILLFEQFWIPYLGGQSRNWTEAFVLLVEGRCDLLYGRINFWKNSCTIVWESCTLLKQNDSPKSNALVPYRLQDNFNSRLHVIITAHHMLWIKIEVSTEQDIYDDASHINIIIITSLSSDNVKWSKFIIDHKSLNIASSSLWIISNLMRRHHMKWRDKKPSHTKSTICHEMELS